MAIDNPKEAFEQQYMYEHKGMLVKIGLTFSRHRTFGGPAILSECLTIQNR